MIKFSALIAFVLMFSGCASMNKDECELANWNAVGYVEGAGGKSISTFQEYQKDCAAHRVKADYEAFKQGHQQGLSEFCSLERGMEEATRGGNYNTICKRSQFPKYNEGYQTGIQLYCSYDRGIGSGSKGDNYNGKCPSSLFPTFNAGYQLGLQQYCSYSNGFELGLNGKPINKNCSGTDFKDFRTGFSVGKARFDDIKMLNELENELLSLRKSMEQAEVKITRAESKIVSDESTPEIRKRALDNIKIYQQEIKALEIDYINLEQEAFLLADKISKQDDASSNK